MHGGRTDSLSEQERQQISMLVTIASGIAGGLAGNSTASAGTGPWQVRTRLRITTSAMTRRMLLTEK
ncbi:VENN motif pre-toxin domain-containing protein [Escherichia coli]|nr:VENN motif pre-toxin domain-containing protein [Escherichia coli]EFC2190934.1 hemagglutinin [Escherichia coli]